MAGLYVSDKPVESSVTWCILGASPRPARCHAAGLLTLSAGTYGNVLRFLPPLVMPDHLLEEGLGILEKAIREV